LNSTTLRVIAIAPADHATTGSSAGGRIEKNCMVRSSMPTWPPATARTDERPSTSVTSARCSAHSSLRPADPVA
jgi:hypothetical protein